MPVARNKLETVRYVTIADRALPPERQSVFLLRPLSNKTRAQIQNLVQLHNDGKTSPLLGSMRRAALKAGLIGWENFADAGGTPVPFATEKGPRLFLGVEVVNAPTDETLEWLSPEDEGELANAIINHSTLDEDDAKN